MRKFVQIYNNQAHWIFESEEKPEFAPNIILMDITDLEDQPEEGWHYNEETEEFSIPEPVLEEPTEQPTPEAMQMQTLLNTEYLVVMSELKNL